MALRLRELHRTRERFAAGTLSYSKGRAITRIADPALKDTMIAHADASTAAVLNGIVADTMRCRDAATGSDVARRRRTGVTVGSQDGGVVAVTVRLLPEDAARFSSMLDRLVELDEAADRADGVEDVPTRGERQTRAVVEALESAVEAGPTDTSGSGTEPAGSRGAVRRVGSTPTTSSTGRTAVRPIGTGRCFRGSTLADLTSPPADDARAPCAYGAGPEVEDDCADRP